MTSIAASAASPFSIGSLVQTTLSLALVLASILAVAWALKRARLAPRGGRGTIGVIDQLAIGPRERVVLVRVGDAQLLLGIGPSGIVGLAPLANPVAVDPPAATATGFADRLREFLGRSAGTAG
ncbi:MAG: flagellar biosynthetic protein FliO [Gammaproteobacteria bacterium]|nr:flagellar biosynthetic protein FliO [Gammaproteobacteria bacterium]